MHLDNIWVDDNVVKRRLDNECVSHYAAADAARDYGTRIAVLKRLLHCGILGATKVGEGIVSPLFIKKKNGKQRFVLDCRDVNRYFCRPLNLRWQRPRSINISRIPRGGPFILRRPTFIIVSTRLISLQSFVVAPVPRGEYPPEELSESGLQHDIHCVSCSKGSHSLCLTAHGGWSCWIVQGPRYGALQKCRFPSRRCFVGNWPLPDLLDGPVALP